MKLMTCVSKKKEDLLGQEVLSMNMPVLPRLVLRCLPLYIIAIFCGINDHNTVASIAPRLYFSNVRTPQSPIDPVIADAANVSTLVQCTLRSTVRRWYNAL